jgi:hypothetical protein
LSLFETLFDALNAGGMRYVVVGGLATVLHGYARLTADVDLVVDLSPHEAKKTIDVLTQFGLLPRAPVVASQFADDGVRQGWVRDKGMRVFSLWDPKEPLREVDLFVQHPIPFADLYARSEVVTVNATDIRIASIADLITLKRIAGRPEDLADIEALEAIAARKEQRD